ncbi:MAG: YheC/YheD family protein [Alicyclobacillus sp.]|nr:YheC/YheD family protein [Alicyclobacillus sp.]
MLLRAGRIASSQAVRIRRPASLQKHITNRPTLGFYVYLVTSKTRPFGEQTQMFEDLTQLGKTMGVDVCVLTPGCLRRLKAWRFEPESGRWLEVHTSIPKVVIRRAGKFLSTSRKVVDRELATLRQAGRLHTLPQVCSNKWRLYQFLRKELTLRPLLVKSALARSPEEVYALARRWGDVYVKPLTGSQGMSIHRILVHPDGVQVRYEDHWVPRTTERLSTAFQPETVVCEQTCQTFDEFQRFWCDTGLFRCLVQETVHLPTTPKHQPFDFRWLMQCTGEPMVIARVARIGQRGAVTTNIHTGGQAVSADALLKSLQWPDAERLIKRLDAAAMAVCHVLERRFGPFAEVGIDFAAREDDSIAIFEVNPTPGRRMLRSLGGNVRELSLRYLLEYAIRANRAGIIPP